MIHQNTSIQYFPGLWGFLLRTDLSSSVSTEACIFLPSFLVIFIVTLTLIIKEVFTNSNLSFKTSLLSSSSKPISVSFKKSSLGLRDSDPVLYQGFPVWGGLPPPSDPCPPMEACPPHQENPESTPIKPLVPPINIFWRASRAYP